LGRIVETENGVYQPRPLILELSMFSIAFLTICVFRIAGKINISSALVYVSALSFLLTARLYGLRKFGKNGRPCTTLDGDTLVFAQPTSSKGALRFLVTDLSEIQIYGPTGRRRYKFVSKDDTSVEAVPMWDHNVDEVVTHFFRRRMPQSINLVVAEPQTFFASVRGDGL
jgi:hypothetical protein